MAIAIPHRPRYRSRGRTIHYLLNGVMVIRTRPTKVADPKTPLQRRQRLRMRVASHFLASFRDMVELGFAPELKDNFRQVGGYQLALGQLMREALRSEGDRVMVDLPRVRLSEGRTNPMLELKASVRAGVLRISWTGKLPKRCESILIGIWSREKAKSRCINLPVNDIRSGFSIPIPSGWDMDSLDVWVAPWAPGEHGRYDSLYTVAVPTNPMGQPSAPGKMPSATMSDLASPLGEWPRPKPAELRRIMIVDVYSGRRRRR